MILITIEKTIEKTTGKNKRAGSEGKDENSKSYIISWRHSIKKFKNFTKKGANQS